MGRIDLATQRKLEKYINKDLITDTARICCLWDDKGAICRSGL